MTKINLAIKDDVAFAKAIASGTTQIKSGKKNFWNAALYALAHYDVHGDHGKINLVLNGLKNVGVGAGAFRQWVEMYSDQVYSNELKKFVRDVTSERTTRASFEAASKENFWVGVAKADESALEFGADDFTKELSKLLNRFGKRKAKDNDATETLEFFKRQLKAKAPAVVLS
jgi:hypothetical protein